MKHKVAVPSYDTGSDNACGIHSASDAAMNTVKAYVVIEFMTQSRIASQDAEATVALLQQTEL